MIDASHFLGQIVQATWTDAECEQNVDDVAALRLPHMETFGRVIRADATIIVIAHNRQTDGDGTPDVTKLDPRWLLSIQVLMSPNVFAKWDRT